MNHEDVFQFQQKMCRWKNILDYGNLVLFLRNFTFGPTHSELSEIIVTWKRCEYFTMGASSSSIKPFKRIDFLADKISIPEFMEKFQN